MLEGAVYVLLLMVVWVVSGWSWREMLVVVLFTGACGVLSGLVLSV